jgi:hypothetical protein
MSFPELTWTASVEPESPAWWLARLLPRLDRQAVAAERLDTYYRGEQLIPVHANRSVSDAYRRLMAISGTNFGLLIVEAVRERMSPGGFRTGAVPDRRGDSEAWAMWQANALDADCDLVHRAMLAMSAGYVIVGRDPVTGEPVITPEDPRQVYAECDPVRRRLVRAAVKVFHDDVMGADRALLYLPGKLYRAARPAMRTGPMAVPAPMSFDPAGWEWEGPTEVIPTRRIPVVPFLNRPDVFGNPLGEFEPVLNILDRINYTILSRLEIATMQAFRQRAVKGLRQRDAAGNPIDYDDIFAADPGAMWQLPETAELWESGQVDLTPVRMAIRDDVEHLAAVSRMPVGYLQPDNESATGVQYKREGLVFTAEDRCKQAGESWEQVMSIAFEVAGDEARASRADMEIIWRSVERATLTERASAASQAQAAGLPWRAAMEMFFDASQQEIDRWEAQRAAESLQQAALMQLAAPVVPVEPTKPPPSTEGP